VRSYRTFAPLPPISYQLSVISDQLSVISYQWKVISEFTFVTDYCVLITEKRGRYFSVALSSRSRALDVIQQVWSFGSSDFPRNHW